MILKKKGPPIQVFPHRCAGCLICELRCSLRFEKAFNPTKARIKIRRLVRADTEYRIVFDEACDNCGLCARHCPYEALVQEKKKGADAA
jgi:ferredoxin